VNPAQGHPAQPLSISALCAGEDWPAGALQHAQRGLESPAAPRRRGGREGRPAPLDSARPPAPPAQAQTSAPASPRGGKRLAQLSLKGRALRLLAGREHSRAELERKLAEHTQDQDELARILDDLQTKGFINEARVVESVLHRRSARLGSARIAHELRGKGLAPEAIAQATRQLQASELERARTLWARKFGQPATEPKEQARQSRFLLSRGFNAEVVRKVLAQDD